MSFRFAVTAAMAASLTAAQSSSAAAAGTAATIHFPASKPTTAVTVPADFVGIGFETANFNNYTNSFAQNLIDSLAQRMAVRPVIRIGGTSGDNLHYNPNQKANVSCAPLPGCQYNFMSDYVLGPSYFKGFTSFGQSKMSFQAPLSGKINLTNTIDFVSNAYDALTARRLAGIALGNEVNGYEGSAQAYVNDAKTLESSIIGNLSLSRDGRTVFEVLDTQSEALAGDGTFSLADAFDAGLDSNGFTKIAAQHYYQIDANDHFQSSDYTPANLQKYLMNHAAITNKFQPIVKWIGYLARNSSFADIQYVLSETGSVLGGPYDFSSSFGACLWAVDFRLYAMTVGVKRVDATQRPTATHAFLVPNPVPGISAPQVRAPYYALPFIADFVSNSGAAQAVVEQDLPSNSFSAYGMYSGGTLSRVALVNLRMWRRSDGNQRGSQTFPVQVPGSATSVRVRRLHADAGAEALGSDVNPNQHITYAGQEWSYSVDDGKGHSVGAVDETVQVKNGVANVVVPDSEAVIVYL